MLLINTEAKKKKNLIDLFWKRLGNQFLTWNLVDKRTSKYLSYLFYATWIPGKQNSTWMEIYHERSTSIKMKNKQHT